MTHRKFLHKEARLLDRRIELLAQSRELRSAPKASIGPGPFWIVNHLNSVRAKSVEVQLKKVTAGLEDVYRTAGVPGWLIPGLRAHFSNKTLATTAHHYFHRSRWDELGVHRAQYAGPQAPEKRLHAAVFHFAIEAATLGRWIDQHPSELPAVARAWGARLEALTLESPGAADVDIREMNAVPVGLYAFVLDLSTQRHAIQPFKDLRLASGHSLSGLTLQLHMAATTLQEVVRLDSLAAQKSSYGVLDVLEANAQASNYTVMLDSLD